MAFSVSYVYEIQDKYTRIADKINRATRRLWANLERTSEAAEKAGGKLDKLSSELSSVGRVSAEGATRLNSVANSVTRLENRMNSATTSTDRAGDRLNRLGNELSNLGNAIPAVVGGAGLKALVDKSTALEDKMSDVSRVVNFANNTELAAFRERIISLSGPLAETSENIAEIIFQGSKFGIPKDQLIDFAVTTRKMALAFDMSADEAGAAIGSIKAKLDLSMPSVVALADSVNFLADNFATSGGNMIEIIARTSGSMKLLKMPPEMVAGWAGFADQLEVSPELAASGINQIINRLSKMKDVAPALMAKPTATIRKIMQTFAEMPEAQRAQALFETFGDEAGRFMIKAVGNIELFDKTLAAAKGMDKVGSMDKEFTKFFDRTSTMNKKLSLSFGETFRAIGDVIVTMVRPVIPILTSLSNRITAFVKQHPTLTKIGVVIAVVTVAITGMAVAAGLLFSALGAVIPALTAIAAAVAGITAPVWIVIGAVAAFAAILVTWWRSGNAFTETLKKMWASIIRLGATFGRIMLRFADLLNLSAAAKGGFDLFTEAIDFLGTALTIFLKPLQLVILSLETMLNIAEKLLAGDLAGIWETFKEGSVEFFKTAIDFKGAETAPPAIDFEGVETAPPAIDLADTEKAARDRAKAETNNLVVSGGIMVAAERGTKVTEQRIVTNTGSNLAMGF